MPPSPDTPRSRALAITNTMVLHLHPVKVDRRAIRVSYTWGLGGISLLMFLILTATGIWLMFYYVPAVPEAYDSMHLLNTGVVLGRFVRNLHRWAAHGMVIAVWLHMTRVFFTGSYKRPREFNWVIGVGLFLVTVALSFTGYLLPWDQLAYWAISVGSNMAKSMPVLGTSIQRLLLGGSEVGPITLIRWYTLHVVLLPVVCLFLMATHFWRIRKDGGISTPAASPTPDGRPGEPSSGPRADMVYTWPHLVSVEAVMALALALALSLMSTFVNAPLLDMANPDRTPNPAKAPWYLVGLQELLLHMHPALSGVVVPVAVLVLLGLIPYLDRDRKGVGTWFSTRRGPVIAAVAAGWTVAAEVALVLFDEFFVLTGMPAGAHGLAPALEFLAARLGLGPNSIIWFGSVLLPLAVMVTIPWALVAVLRRVWRNLEVRELAIAMYSFFLTSFVVLTVIGTAFRGVSMQLTWPWLVPPPI